MEHLEAAHATLSNLKPKNKTEAKLNFMRVVSTDEVRYVLACLGSVGLSHAMSWNQLGPVG